MDCVIYANVRCGSHPPLCGLCCKSTRKGIRIDVINDIPEFALNLFRFPGWLHCQHRAINCCYQAQYMLAFVFLSTCLQLPNHLFRLTAIQSWNWHSLHQITSSLIAFALLCMEISFSGWHLRTIFKRIYSPERSDKCQAENERTHKI